MPTGCLSEIHTRANILVTPLPKMLESSGVVAPGNGGGPEGLQEEMKAEAFFSHLHDTFVAMRSAVFRAKVPNVCTREATVSHVCEPASVGCD